MLISGILSYGLDLIWMAISHKYGRFGLPTCRASWIFIFWSHLSYIDSNYFPKYEDSKWLNKGMAWG